MEKVILKNNETIKEYDILFTFNYNNKKYVTYTNYEKDENGNLKCFSSVQENDNLLQITDVNALNIVDEMLKTLTSATKQKYKNQ